MPRGEVRTAPQDTRARRPTRHPRSTLRRVTKRKQTDPGRPGHRSRLETDPVMRDLIIKSVAAGLPYSRAALAARVDERQLREWMRRGRDSIQAQITAEELNEDPPPCDEPYHTFTVDILAADAEGERGHLDTITGHAGKDWRAAAWILERRHRDTWATRVMLSGDPDAPLAFTPAEQPPVDRAALAAEVIAALATDRLLLAELADLVIEEPDDGPN